MFVFNNILTFLLRYKNNQILELKINRVYELIEINEFLKLKELKRLVSKASKNENGIYDYSRLNSSDINFIENILKVKAEYYYLKFIESQLLQKIVDEAEIEEKEHKKLLAHIDDGISLLTYDSNVTEKIQL